MVASKMFSDICNRTPCHGVADWYNSHKWSAKLVWTLILLGAGTAIVYYTYQMVVAYLQYQTVTSISEVRVTKMPFPNVTVCFDDRFNKKFVESNITLPPSVLPAGHDERSIRVAFFNYFLALSYQPVRLTQSEIDYLQSVYQYNFNSTVNTGAMDILSFLNQSAYPCEDTFIYCQFTLKLLDCCRMMRLVFSDYGVCYHFQIRNRDETDTGPASQLGAGNSFGLSITVQQFESDLRVPPVQDESFFRLHFTPYLEPDDVGSLLVRSKARSMIRLNPTQSMVDPTLGSCWMGPKALAYHQSYSVGLCHNECVYNTSMTECGCVPVGYQSQLTSDMVCSPQDMINCVQPIINAAQSQEKNDLSHCYQEQCPSLCSTWNYAPSVSYTGLLSSGNIKTELMIYYDKLQYTKIVQQPLMNLEQFICNLAGMWGFWCGMSAVCFVQCIYLVLCGEYKTDWRE